MIRTKESFPTIEVPFEDIAVALVQNYDAFLRPEYGDYMELPPVEKRKNHYPHLLCLGNENERTES